MGDIFAIWKAHPGVAAFWSAIAFLLGAYVNHRSAIKRDRDKEFNALSDPIRQKIRRELRDIRANAQFVETSPIELLADVAWPVKRNRLRKALAAYKEARIQHRVQDSLYGEFSYTRTDHVEKALCRLLKLTARQ